MGSVAPNGFRFSLPNNEKRFTETLHLVYYFAACVMRSFYYYFSQIFYKRECIHVFITSLPKGGFLTVRDMLA